MEVSQEWIAVGNQKTKWTLTRRQWFILGCLTGGNFCLACCSSLQAPFFPQESEKKGAKPSEYGLVFGIFYLTMSVFSPIWGKVMSTLTPKFLLDAGMFLVGGCFVIFGFLEKAPSTKSYLALAYSIRIVEGIGSAAYKTSNFAIVANTFPDNVATAFGAMETMFGLGLIVGPTLGGALYEVGGFILPFVVAGSLLLICAAVTFFALPQTDNADLVKGKISILTFLKHPAVFLYALLTGASNMALGFNHTTLEPHIRQFNLSPLDVGLMFVLAGGLYGLTSPIWGYLCDKKFNANALTAIGNCCMFFSYVFIGPLPFLKMPTTLWLVVIALILYGVGFGGVKVTAYIVCLQEAVRAGYRIDLSIYGLISGTFTAAFAVGYFIGSAGGGVLVTNISYESTCGILAAIMLVGMAAVIIFAIQRHIQDAKIRAALGDRSRLIPK